MGEAVTMDGLEHKILVVDEDAEMRGNIIEMIEKRLVRCGSNSHKYINVVGTDLVDRYQQCIRDPQTSVVVMNYGMSWFMDKTVDLEYMAQKNIAAILIFDHVWDSGKVIDLTKRIPVAGCLQKPSHARRNIRNAESNDLKAQFYTELGDKVENSLHDSPRIRKTIGIIGVGETGAKSACEFADGIATIFSALEDPPPRIILYNRQRKERKETSEARLQEAYREAKNIATRHGKTEILVADDLSALYANAGVVILAYGNRGFEFKAESGKSTPLKFYDRYWRDTVEIYKSLSGNASVIHVTNPVEPLVTLGRLFINTGGVKAGEGERVEGFVMNDYFRCLKKLNEWGGRLTRETSSRLATSAPQAYLKLFGRHHGYVGVLEAHINGMMLPEVARRLRATEISNDSLIYTLFENKEQIKQAMGRAAEETARSLVSVVESLVNARDSYAAINIHPWNYNAFNHRTISIDRRSMGLKDFWQKKFPNGTVIDVPVLTQQRYRFPDAEALNRAIGKADVRVFARDQYSVRNMMVQHARDNCEKYPDLVRVLQHFNEK